MKNVYLTFAILGFFSLLNAQNVGIGTNTPKELAKLDISSSTSGLLLPRLTTTQRATLGGNVSALGAALSAQYNGLMIYDTENNTLYIWDPTKTDFTNGGWINILDADASINDGDADPNNEIQNLSSTASGTNRTINISGGTGTTISVADNDNSATNEIQDLSLAGNTLSLSGDATTVNLSSYLDNTDNQDLSLSGNTLSLTNDASTVNLSGYLDNTDDQKIDVFSLTGNTLNLSLESDAEATKIVDLSTLKDHDWYEVGGTNQADNISDNIYTQGTATIGATSPTAGMTLDVNGNLFARKYVIQNGQDGGNTRGIWMWTATDTNWGIYMGQSGANRSFSNGTATAGGGFTQHAIRFRVNNSATQGFIFENASENNLFSIKGDNGRATFSGPIVYDCDGCGSTSTIDGTSNYGDLVIQGRVLSANSNLHLSPPGGSNVVINDTYRAAGGTSTGAAGLQVESLEGTGDRLVFASSNGTVGAIENSMWTMSANFAHSPDDWCDGCSGTGALPDNVDDFTQLVTMPFSLVINGTSYNQLSICTNGWIAFGNTGSAALGNGAIPTSSIGNLPIIFPYWDDLRDFGGGEFVRYGYAGTAPNRVYIVDYSMRPFSGGGRVNFQVQIHETSGLINVKYRDEMSPNLNGQSASIGFQISSTKGYPISYNAKVFDDNNENAEGWSVSPVR